MTDFIPAFDVRTMVLEPWSEGFRYDTLWIVVMATFVGSACGLVGTFVLLRRMALVGDAISHSLLPGIVLAFMLANSRATLPMFLGALVAGLATVVLIEAVHRSSRVKPDAAIGIVFSSLFAFGVVLISLFADRVDLDVDCVLYGEIDFVPLETAVSVFGIEAPIPVVRMAAVLIVVAMLIGLFFKELVLTSFDSGLARSLGFSTAIIHYSLMAILSIVIVTAFEATGAILVIAMLIFPGATAQLLSDRLPIVLFMAALFPVLYALGGFHLSYWLNSNTAGAVVSVAGAIFGLVWMFSPRRGLIRQLLRRRRHVPVPPPEIITQTTVSAARN